MKSTIIGVGSGRVYWKGCSNQATSGPLRIMVSVSERRRLAEVFYNRMRRGYRQHQNVFRVSWEQASDVTKQIFEDAIAVTLHAADNPPKAMGRRVTAPLAVSRTDEKGGPP